MTSDAQAALAAAAAVISKISAGYTAPFMAGETLRMADEFLGWLQRADSAAQEAAVDDAQERNRRAVRAFHRRSVNINLCVCGREWPCEYRTVHDLSPTRTTPSGARACVCGDKWPCSQSQWREEPS